MFEVLALTLSIMGMLQFLLILAVIVLLIIGIRWLLAKVGWEVPPAMWAVIGFIVIILLVIWMLGGGTGVSVTK